MERLRMKKEKKENRVDDDNKGEISSRSKWKCEGVRIGNKEQKWKIIPVKGR